MRRILLFSLMIIFSIEGRIYADTIVPVNEAWEMSILEDVTALNFFDYDGDNDLDLVGGNGHVLRNDGLATFTYYEIFADVSGNTKWADYDNDGDFDFIFTGRSESDLDMTDIYRNDDGVFTPIHASIKLLTGVGVVDSPWVDYDNDGLKDVLIGGNDEVGDAYAILYKNLGKDRFIETGIKFHGSRHGYYDWGDFNKDGYPDLLIKDGDIDGNSRITIYTNFQGESFIPIAIYPSAEPLDPKVSPVEWGDLDADGDLDFLLQAYTWNQIQNSPNWPDILSLATNDSASFAESDIDLDGYLLWDYSLSDLNNDGYLDIFGYGETEFQDQDQNWSGYVHIWLNNGKDGFSDLTLYSTDVDRWSSAFEAGDYDNDGDLDLIQNYNSWNIDLQIVILENKSDISNTKPTVPDNLSVLNVDNEIFLKWDPSTDNETPTKMLSYNVRIGSEPGAIDIMAPAADVNTGFVRSPEYGNASADTFKIIRQLEPGTYYWSVQAIDNMYAGSAFSKEDSFVIRPMFSRMDGIIPDLNGSQAAVGDYDLDGDYDYIISGSFAGFEGGMTVLYKNNNDSTFSEVPIQFEGITDGMMTFCDYNNDQYPDILYSGIRIFDNNPAVYLYRNDKNDQFSLILERELQWEFWNRPYSCWSDLDNDGDQDIVVASAYTSEILLNEGNDQFVAYLISDSSRISTSFICDYDNDMDNDIFLAFEVAEESHLFKNIGDLKFERITSSYSGLLRSMADVGDIDGDGYLDFILAGVDPTWTKHTWLHRNLANDSFELVDHNMRNIYLGKAGFGDFDNDNDADVVIGGQSNSSTLRIYENIGNNEFEEVFSQLYDRGYWEFFTTITDYNNDQNLDIMRSGILYSNNLDIEKAAPEAPLNLEHQFDDFNVILSWDPVINSLNNSQFSYNVRIGTSPGLSDVVSPLSDPITGKRSVFGIGNAQLCKGFKINKLERDAMYYWSVQAIDQSFAGGAWSEEKSFTTPAIIVDFSAANVCLGEAIKFVDISDSPNEDISGWEWDFGDGTFSEEQHPSHLYSTPGTFNVSLTINTASFTQIVSRELTVSQGPEADFDFDVIALGQHTPFRNTTETHEISITSWHWDFGDGVYSTLENPEYHKYDKIGEFEVTLTVRAENGCSDSITKTIAVCLEPLPVPEIYVRGPVVWYLAASIDGPYTYTWHLNGEIIEGAEDFIYVANQTLGIYKVAIEDESGCMTSSDEVTIPVMKSAMTDFTIPEAYVWEETDPWKSLRIYPNPTSGLFTLEMDNSILGELIIDIYGEKGNQIINIEFTKETNHFKTQIDLSAQPSGVYLIGLMFEHYKTNRKLVLK